MTYNTKQRDILIQFFNNNYDKSFTVEEITSRLASQGISQSAVYRNLNSLLKSGKVHKTTRPDSRCAYYQYVDCSKCKGHLHLECKNCGKTTHLDQDDADNLIRSVLAKSNFNVDKTDTVIYGICKNCDKKLR